MHSVADASTRYQKHGGRVPRSASRRAVQVFQPSPTIGNKETPTSYSVKQIEKYCEQYLRWRASAAKITPGIPCLQKFAIKSLVKALRDDKAAGADTIVKHLAPSQLANLVDNPGLHYSAFRVFHDLESDAEARQRLRGTVSMNGSTRTKNGSGTARAWKGSLRWMMQS